jgi:hypothetical protein
MDNTAVALALVGSFVAKNVSIVDQGCRALVFLAQKPELKYNQLVQAGAIILGKATFSVSACSCFLIFTDLARR